MTNWISPKTMKWLVALSLTALVLALVLYVRTFGLELSDNREHWGQFGDYLGGTLNPIFGFLTVLLLVTTVWLQRVELEHSIRELKASSKALEEQSKSLKLQNFDNTFFRLLDLHGNTDSAMNFIERGWSGLVRALKNSQVDILSGDPNEIAEAYTKFEKGNPNLRQYFRVLNAILEYVEEGDLDDNGREKYMRLLLAQMSPDELALLFYHCVTATQGRLAKLAAKYGVLRDVEPGQLPGGIVLASRMEGMVFGTAA